MRDSTDKPNLGLLNHLSKCAFAPAYQMLVCIVAVISSPPQLLWAQNAKEEHPYFFKTAHEPAARWTYDGPTGPEFWAELDKSYRLAKTGKHQSPIDISARATTTAVLPELKFHYVPERIAAINNGHTIQHDESSNSYLSVGTDAFALKQYHVHTPSEHTLDGKHFEMEIHFVHKSETGKVAVVAVLVEGQDTSSIDFPLYYLPSGEVDGIAYEGTRNAQDFLPSSLDYFSYSGSFTTPPCTEDVIWIVLKQPVAIPSSVIARFRAILKANNRPVQQLNDRVIRQSR